MFRCLFIAFIAIFASESLAQNQFNALVFSKTNGFRHKSIESGKNMLFQLSQEKNFDAFFTEDSLFFTSQNLKAVDIVIFLNTTGNIFGDNEEKVFREFIENGGALLGIHAASDTEYDWQWYGEVVGNYFESHPKIQKARLNVLDQKHPAMKHLPKTFHHTDEWYNFSKEFSDDLHILMTLDEQSYEGGKNGVHPISWCREIGEGKAFYTGLGHTDETYEEEFFIQHIWGAMKWCLEKIE